MKAFFFVSLFLVGCAPGWYKIPDRVDWDCGVVADSAIGPMVPAVPMTTTTCRYFSSLPPAPLMSMPDVTVNDDDSFTCTPDTHTVAEKLRTMNVTTKRKPKTGKQLKGVKLRTIPLS